jgi:hypothetical protein
MHATWRAVWVTRNHSDLRVFRPGLRGRRPRTVPPVRSRNPASSPLGIQRLFRAFTDPAGLPRLTPAHGERRTRMVGTFLGVSSLIATLPRRVHSLRVFPAPTTFRPQGFAPSRRFTPRFGLRPCFMPLPRPGFTPPGVWLPSRRPCRVPTVWTSASLCLPSLRAANRSGHNDRPRPRGFAPSGRCVFPGRVLSRSGLRSPHGVLPLQGSPSRRSEASRPSSHVLHDLAPSMLTRSLHFGVCAPRRARFDSLEPTDPLEVSHLSGIHSFK